MFDLRVEASGCLNCPNAKCSEACPLNVRIPEINKLIREDKIDEAFDIAFDDNPLGLVCGIVCPHEKQCEGSCIKRMIDKNIEIGQIEENLWKWKMSRGMIGPRFNNGIVSNTKVAIVGGGPAGIACASLLLRGGIDVTIYEKENFLGGILVYGIPNFRLDDILVKQNIDFALNYKAKGNLNIEYNNLLVKKGLIVDGYRTITLEELEKEYDFVFISIGLEKSKSLGLSNNNNKDYIINAHDFLRNNYDVIDKKVVVIGGGNVAIDSARKAKKNGADVTIIYRRRKEDMPANTSEIEEAIEEGVEFIFTTKVLEITKEEKLNLTLDNGSKFTTDYLIEAIGSEVNKNYFDDGIEFTKENYVKVDDDFKIENRNLFFGGDLVSDTQTVANAVHTGLKVANEICNSNL